MVTIKNYYKRHGSVFDLYSIHNSASVNKIFQVTRILNVSVLGAMRTVGNFLRVEGVCVHWGKAESQNANSSPRNKVVSYSWANNLFHDWVGENVLVTYFYVLYVLSCLGVKNEFFLSHLPHRPTYEDDVQLSSTIKTVAI